MARPKGSKNKSDEESTVENEPVSESVQPEQKPEQPKENEPETISVFEAAERFATSEATIKVWIDHGHLTGSNGRVHTRSIRECRFNTRRMI